MGSGSGNIRPETEEHNEYVCMSLAIYVRIHSLLLLALISMLCAFVGLLCPDLSFPEAGSFAPRQLSVGTQSIIDGSPGLRL